MTHAGIVYSAYSVDENEGTFRYEVPGDNSINVTVVATGWQEPPCVAGVALRQSTDIKHSIKLPIEFTPRDALQADRLSAAASEQMGLIRQELQGKTVKQIVISAQRADKFAPADPALVQLAELLRAEFIDQGVSVDLIERRVDAAGDRSPVSGDKVAIDVLIR